MICQRVYCAELLRDFYRRSTEEGRAAALKMRRRQRTAAVAINARNKLLSQMRENRGYEL